MTPRERVWAALRGDRVDRPPVQPHAAMQAEIADMEAMIAQMGDNMSVDSRADLAFARAVEGRAATFSEVAEQAAICVARLG